MYSVSVAAIALGCVFGGALLGLTCRSRLPQHHLDKASFDIVKLGMGTVATLTALVLGLLVSSAKASFDTKDREVKQFAAKLIVLDRTMARLGAGTEPTRALLRQFLAAKIDELWPTTTHRSSHRPSLEALPVIEVVQDQLLALAPRGEAERRVQSRAIGIAEELEQGRWLLMAQSTATAVPRPFLVILVFWATILYFSFGLFAPRNGTVILALWLCALSLAGAIFLVLEMDRPLAGLIRISSAPLRQTLAQMGH